MTSADLICWILYSGRLKGLFSQYAYDGGAGELADRSPIFIDANDPEHIIAVGKTDLSDEALMHIVEHQKESISAVYHFRRRTMVLLLSNFYGALWKREW